MQSIGRKKIKYKKIFISSAIAANVFLLSFLTIIPIIWMISTSLKPLEEIFSIPPSFISPHMDLTNYVDVLTKSEIGGGYFRAWLMNSVVYTLGTLPLTLLLAVFSSYAFARFNFPGRQVLFGFILFTQLVPETAIMIPLFQWLISLNLFNSQIGLILVYVIGNLPMAVWLLEGYFEGVPVELEESALVDGCSRIGAIFRILLRLALPGLIATGLYVFHGVWNEYTFSLILTATSDLRPLSVGLKYYMHEHLIQWGRLMAASTLGAAPVLFLFIFMRKSFIKGMLEGALKG